ncbi:hypothetical protein PPGU19_092010 (plasmid) [Paraburkholderia sp. PGU19]|nr:hypothetical protein PPGU19_092010 [Paraburkholderia sp. PGU19]
MKPCRHLPENAIPNPVAAALARPKLDRRLGSSPNRRVVPAAANRADGSREDAKFPRGYKWSKPWGKTKLPH